MRALLILTLLGAWLAPSVVQAQPPRMLLDAFRQGPAPRIEQPMASPIRLRMQGPSVVEIYSEWYDLSNVVLEYDNGGRQRFENLQGRMGRFSGTGPQSGRPIHVVWVKAGPNFSGDGPGYGQRFVVPGTPGYQSPAYQTHPAQPTRGQRVTGRR